MNFPILELLSLIFFLWVVFIGLCVAFMLTHLLVLTIFGLSLLDYTRGIFS